MDLTKNISELMLPMTTQLVVDDPGVTELLEPKKLIETLYQRLVTQVVACERILDYIASDEAHLSIEQIELHRKERRIEVSLDGKRCDYDLELFQKMIEKLRLFAIPLLPLGSAVTLSGVEEGENPIFIITERFVIPEMMRGGYFDYAGVVYPLGSVDASKRIMFGHHRIKEVVHEGYADGLDLECQTYIKELLLNEKGLFSIDLRNQFFFDQYEKMSKRGERSGF